MAGGEGGGGEADGGDGDGEGGSGEGGGGDGGGEGQPPLWHRDARASFDAVIVLDGKDIAAPFERRDPVDKADDDHEALHLSRGSDTCQVALE